MAYKRATAVDSRLPVLAASLFSVACFLFAPLSCALLRRACRCACARALSVAFYAHSYSQTLSTARFAAPFWVTASYRAPQRSAPLPRLVDERFAICFNARASFAARAFLRCAARAARARMYTARALRANARFLRVTTHYARTRAAFLPTTCYPLPPLQLIVRGDVATCVVGYRYWHFLRTARTRTTAHPTPHHATCTRVRWLGRE